MQIAPNLFYTTIIHHTARENQDILHDIRIENGPIKNLILKPLSPILS